MKTRSTAVVTIVFMLVLIATLAACGSQAPVATTTPTVTVTTSTPAVTITQTVEVTKEATVPSDGFTLSESLQKSVLQTTWDGQDSEQKELICLYWKTNRGEALKAFINNDVSEQFETRVVSDFFDAECAAR